MIKMTRTYKGIEHTLKMDGENLFLDNEPVSSFTAAAHQVMVSHGASAGTRVNGFTFWFDELLERLGIYESIAKLRKMAGIK